MIGHTEEGGDVFVAALKEDMRQMEDLSQYDARATYAVLKTNSAINFDPSHPKSHFVVDNGRVEIGSYRPGYFKLLSLPLRWLVSIYTGGRNE